MKTGGLFQIYSEATEQLLIRDLNKVWPSLHFFSKDLFLLAYPWIFYTSVTRLLLPRSLVKVSPVFVVSRGIGE